jgi:hypothetical protein
MHDHLKAEVELMGYKPENVTEDSNLEQDFLIMSRLMRVSRTSDFSEEELAYYQEAAAAAEERYVVGGRILTKDFSDEELKEYQWSADHPTGSCRGVRLTDEPTEEEVKGWQDKLEWLNKLDFVAIRKRVEFYDREPNNKPYSDDPFADIFPENAMTTNVVASCDLGNDPYSLNSDW